MATDPVQSFSGTPIPVGPVDPDPELAFVGRAASPAFPNGGVYFPGGVEAHADPTTSAQKGGAAPMQADLGYAQTAGDDAERQAGATTPSRGEMEPGGPSTGYVPNQPGTAQGGAVTQAAPGTLPDPGLSAQQTGPETLEQPPAAGAGQAPADAAQGGRNVPADPYAAPTADANPETPAPNAGAAGSTTTSDTGSGADPGAAVTQPGGPTADAPTGVAAASTGAAGTASAASVTFTAPAYTGSSPITSYNVYDENNNNVGSGAASPITTSVLAVGAHTLYVAAVTAQGEGARSAGAAVTI